MSTDEQPAWLTEDEPSSAGSGAPRFQQVGVIDAAEAEVVLQAVRPPFRRPRWLLPVMAALVLLVTVSIVGVWALSGALTDSTLDPARTGYAYVPASATVVAEVRLDLPAGQKEQLGTFLSRFPGFDDASTVETKLVDALDDVVRSATQGQGNYKDDVQSFFSDWVVAAVSVHGATPNQTSPLVLFGVSDRASAETAMLKLRSSTLAWTSEDVGGVQLWSGNWSQPDALDFGLGGQAYAVTDDVVIYGSTADDIKRALDTRAGKTQSLLDTQRFGDALHRVPPGRLGLVWVDIEGSGATAIARQAAAMAGPACAALQSSTPTDGVAALYLRDGRAAIDISYARPAGGPPIQIRQSSLDVHVPADSFLYAEMKRAAGSTSNALDCLRSYPGIKDQLAQLQQSIGNLDDLTSWIGDTGVALRFDGSKVTGGLVIQVTDEIKASEALGQLRAALTALGNQAGGVTVNEETYQGARLVTFEFSGGGLSSLPPILPSISLAYALKDGLLVIGVDASFTRAVLDTQSATSLATKDSYRRALDFAGATQNAGALFVDVPAVLKVADAVEASMPGGGANLGQMRAFLEPLDDAAIFVVGDDRTTTIRIRLNTRDLP
jgi:Protein of unknown function (DUF3352)